MHASGRQAASSSLSDDQTALLMRSRGRILSRAVRCGAVRCGAVAPRPSREICRARHGMAMACWGAPEAGGLGAPREKIMRPASLVRGGSVCVCRPQAAGQVRACQPSSRCQPAQGNGNFLRYAHL